MFTFALGVNVNTRSTISSPVLSGYSLIKRIRLHWSNGQNPPTGTLELGIAQSAVTETLQPTSVPRPFTTIAQPIFAGGYTITSNEAGFFFSNFLTQASPFVIPIDFVVPQHQWFLCISANSAAGVGIQFNGNVDVLDGLTADQLANLI